MGDRVMDNGDSPQEEDQPALGLATTDELLKEIDARLEVDPDITDSVCSNARILVNRLRLIFASHEKLRHRTVDGG